MLATTITFCQSFFIETEFLIRRKLKIPFSVHHFFLSGITPRRGRMRQWGWGGRRGEHVIDKDLHVESGLASGAIKSACSPFSGKPLHIPHSRLAPLRQNCKTSRLTIMMVKPTIQFIQGTDEQTIPDVKLTKSRDGTNGMAIFRFDQPSVFDSSSEVGDITGFYMIDEEGVLQSVDVNAKYINGKPAGIEAKYIMRTPRDWDRFMRFMERYANENGLQFIKK